MPDGQKVKRATKKAQEMKGWGLEIEPLPFLSLKVSENTG
jgi:hypothetical protein